MFAWEKSVGVVVFRRENNQIHYLLLNHGKNYWNFPKGHAEKGEIDEETLRRETEEETGIKNLNIFPEFRKKIFYFYRATGVEKGERLKAGRKLNVFKTVIFYLAETLEKEVRLSSEHVNFDWLNFSEACSRLKYRSSRYILRKAQWAISSTVAK